MIGIKKAAENTTGLVWQYRPELEAIIKGMENEVTKVGGVAHIDPIAYATAHKIPPDTMQRVIDYCVYERGGIRPLNVRELSILVANGIFVGDAAKYLAFPRTSRNSIDEIPMIPMDTSKSPVWDVVGEPEGNK
ncbi:MAG: hypothetical protein HY438_04275 [DPANN group archaeon]|nr:hypothetical protein [DPANN group archaeon]